MSEIGQPTQVSHPESTGEMIKRLRTDHGGTLDASMLSAQEKVAIDSESRLLTDVEQLKFKDFTVKQRFHTSKSEFEPALEIERQRMKELKPVFNLPIIDLYKQLGD